MIDLEVSRTFDRRSALFLTGGVVLTSVLVLRMLQMQTKMALHLQNQQSVVSLAMVIVIFM